MSLELSDDWHSAIFDDFEAICNILGITLSTSTVKLYGGGTRQQPDIYFSGFSSQGDGASFEGTYEYRKGALKDIKQYAPLDSDLHSIAADLQELQRRNFYQLSVRIGRNGSRYVHENTMYASVARHCASYSEVIYNCEEALLECFRKLARWLYRQLEIEYWYQLEELEKLNYEELAN